MHYDYSNLIIHCFEKKNIDEKDRLLLRICYHNASCARAGCGPVLEKWS
jgi:hypothetical protein